MSERRNTLKVLQINAVYNMGSTGVMVREIGDVLEKEGHEVYYAVACSHEKKENLYEIGNLLDHKLHAFFSRVLGRQGYYSCSATIKLLKWVDGVKPDIIHIHNLHSNYINYLYLFKYVQKRKIKTIITLHDCWFFTGKCFHFLYDDCNKWKDECGECPRIHCEQNSFLFDRTKRVLEDKRKYIGLNEQVTVVTVSDWLRTLAQESVLRKREILTIKNGIDLAVFSPQQVDRSDYGISNSKFVVLGMANKWLASENRETFVEITSFLQEDELLLLIGCNKHQLENLPNGVKGVGYIYERERLSEYYSLSDVFVNVTKVDSLPTVNIESLACGTPVVTYNSGGSAEILNSDVGICLEYGDVEGLKKAIRQIKKERKSSYSEKCRKHAQMYYQKDNNYQKYIELYKKLKNK